MTPVRRLPAGGYHGGQRPPSALRSGPDRRPGQSSVAASAPHPVAAAAKPEAYLVPPPVSRTTGGLDWQQGRRVSSPAAEDKPERPPGAPDIGKRCVSAQSRARSQKGSRKNPSSPGPRMGV